MQGIQGVGGSRQVDYVTLLVEVNREDPLIELEEWVQQAMGEEDRLVVASRIRQAYQNNMTSLNLSGMKITCLPDCVGRLSQLEHLDLSRTVLTSLPNTIGQLASLKSLNVSRTALSVLPDTLGDLLALQYLNLSRSLLMTLPDTLGRLVNLQHLNLSRTLLAELPKTIGNLSRLRQFNLARTFIETLPLTIGYLSHLEHLHLANTPLTSLPDSMGQLLTLYKLNLSRTLIKTLPDTMHDLLHLRWLDVSYTGLLAWPDWVDTLPALQHLNIKHTQIEMSPIKSVLSWYKRAGVPEEEGWRWYLFDFVRERYANCFLTLLHCLEKVYDQGINDIFSKQVFAQHVVRVLREMGCDAVLRRSALEIIGEEDADCEDRKLLTFNTIQSIVHSHVLQREAQTNKTDVTVKELQLSLGMFRQSLLDEAALRVMQKQWEENRRTSNDEGTGPNLQEALEVQLALRCALGEVLKLPFPVKGMLYGKVAGLTSADIELAKTWVEQEGSDPKRQVRGLLAQPVWRKYLEDVFREKIDIVQQPFSEAMRKIDEDKEKETISNQVYLAQVTVIAADRTRAIEDFMKYQTEKALADVIG